VGLDGYRTNPPGSGLTTACRLHDGLRRVGYRREKRMTATVRAFEAAGYRFGVLSVFIFLFVAW
jgi:hypothetical protein